MIRTIRAVIFDMDGLMLDTEQAAQRAFQAAMEAMGLPAPADLFPSLVGRNSRESQSLLQSALGPEFSYDTFRQHSQVSYATLVEREGIATKTGLLEILSFLQRTGIAYGVATSSAQSNAWRKLRIAGVDRHFETLVGGDEVARGKPAPDIFLEAARRLQVQPEQCVVLEDSRPGIQAASRASMIPIMVPDLVAPDAELRELAHAIADDLHDARELIEILAGTRGSRPGLGPDNS